MKQPPITFPSGKLSLSGYIYIPDSPGLLPGVVICHPHPLHGGSMSNPVVRQMGNALLEQGIVALMFNFRGVGKSTGRYADGIGEQEDIVAALDWLAMQPQVDTSKIGLFGYSFGGYTGGPVACRDIRVKAMALISPAVQMGNSDYIETCKKPKFIVVGENDDMVPPEIVKAFFDRASEPKQFRSFPGADHFWMGHETSVCNIIASWFKKELG